MQKKTVITVLDIQIDIELSHHSVQRLEEYNLTEYEAFSLIMKLGERLLDLKDGEEFAVIDKECGIGIVCSMNVDYPKLRVDVITAISNEKIWISRGTRVMSINECLN